MTPCPVTVAGTQAFLDKHPDRKIVKKWVHAKVRELATYKSASGWELNPPVVEGSTVPNPSQPKPSPVVEAEETPSKVSAGTAVPIDPGTSPVTTAKSGPPPSSDAKSGKIGKYFQSVSKVRKERPGPVLSSHCG